MESHRYSGYQADDESFRGVQMGSLRASYRQGNYDWTTTMRPPSRCQFRHPDPTASCSTPSSFPSGSPGKRKHHRSTADSTRESNHLANEFSEFVDFLADEDVLDSLQSIVEDAVRKLRDMTTDNGERVFDIQEESSSSLGSDSWSFSYSSTYSPSQYYTTTSSEDDWEQQIRHKPKPGSLLEKYASRLPKLGKKIRDEVSGGLHAETFSEQSGDSYIFQQKHLHIWAKLAESLEQVPRKDYFAKFRRSIPQYSRSVESLQKEITSVLKRPTPSSIPLYYPGHQPFDALDFLEEKKILAALQDIINQAVCKVLDITGMDAMSIFGEGESEEGSEDEDEDEEGEEGSGSGEETSDEDDSKSGSSRSGKKKKKKKRKGKKKKKGKASPVGEEKGKGKYTAPLPKGRRKSTAPEELQRKPKYVPPPLPKTKPRAPPEEPPPKPKYTPPPLPKPRQKKPESALAEAEPQKQAILTKHIITPKDIKRAHLEARPPPRQSIIDFLMENAAKLILYKYNYETLLSEKLGLISVPVTKVLLEIMFGYKKIKGSGIRLSSQINWSTVYDEIYAVRPQKPKPPKVKAKDKKKGKDKKGKAGEKPKKTEEKKNALFKPQMPKGKVVVFKSPTDQDIPSGEKEGGGPATQRGDSEGPEIFEIVPPQFPEDKVGDLTPSEEDGLSVQLSQSTIKDSATPAIPSSPRRSIVPQESLTKMDPLPILSPKKSLSSSRRMSVPNDSNRGSQTFLPEVEPTGSASGDVSRKGSLDGNGSKIVLPKISN